MSNGRRLAHVSSRGPSRSGALIGLLASLALAAGCSPGDVDSSVVGRYQRALADRGPQKRGDGEQGLLRPAETTGPALKVVKDDQTGRTQVFLSLDAAVMRALANNTDIRVVSYDPSVSYEQMVQAASEFDYVLNGTVAYDKTDTPTGNQFAQSGQVGTHTYNVGLAQKAITGAKAQIAWTMTQTVGTSLFGKQFGKQAEQWDNSFQIDVTQPLLRDAWPQFNLANLRVARLKYGTSMAEFRNKVEETVAQVITAYWTLVQARRNKEIQEALLDRTIETRDRVEKRRAVDATDVEVMQTQAAVETTRADLVRAQKVIVDVQDQLVRLIGDMQLNLLDDYEVVPTTRPNRQQVQLDVADQLLTALRHSPALEEARIAIEVADVGVQVAVNQTLPKLDLRATSTVQGLGPDSQQAKDDMNSGDFVGYGLSLTYEYPIGNRERLANLRAQKLGKLKAVSALQNAADMVSLQVRERIREVDATYQEMTAQGSAVVAARNELDALNATEELRQLSPEFLNVKLTAQERLALAESKELAATVGYNTALAGLARATGTVLELQGVQVAMPVVLGEGPAAAADPRPPSQEHAAGKPR